MAIIINLNKILKKRKSTIEALSKQIGITPSNISRLKCGKCSSIRFSTIESICKVLHCKVGDIIEYQADKDNN